MAESRKLCSGLYFYRQFSGRRVRKLENVLFTTGVRLATSESRKVSCKGQRGKGEADFARSANVKRRKIKIKIKMVYLMNKEENQQSEKRF